MYIAWLDPQANVTKYDACSEVIIVNTNNSKEMRILLRKSLQLKAGIKLALRKGDTGLDFNLFDKAGTKYLIITVDDIQCQITL